MNIRAEQVLTVLFDDVEQNALARGVFIYCNCMRLAWPDTSHPSNNYIMRQKLYQQSAFRCRIMSNHSN